MARPTQYDPDKNILVQGWARDGLTNEQIAKNLGITVKTLYEWQNKHGDFRESLKQGKEVVDREVESALFRSAMGFNYREQVMSAKGDVAWVERYEKPNVTAQIFWLKNRKPSQWRDKQELGISGGLKIKLKMPGDTDAGD